MFQPHLAILFALIDQVVYQVKLLIGEPGFDAYGDHAVELVPPPALLARRS